MHSNNARTTTSYVLLAAATENQYGETLSFYSFDFVHVSCYKSIGSKCPFFSLAFSINSLVRAKRHYSKNYNNSEFSGPGGGLVYLGSCLRFSCDKFLSLINIIGAHPKKEKKKGIHLQESQTSWPSEKNADDPLQYLEQENDEPTELASRGLRQRTLALLRASQPLILIRPILVSPSKSHQ